MKWVAYDISRTLNSILDNYKFLDELALNIKPDT